MRVAAVDMGATSVRVAVIDLDAETPEIEVVHRWFHGPETRSDGSVRWRWGELLDNVRLGLARARASRPARVDRRRRLGRRLRAAGRGRGRCCPTRTATGARAPRVGGDVARSLGEAELYRRTGIQLMPINTIFQLAAHDRDELARARRLVMLPELVAYELTGEAAGELSNAGTTGLLDVATGDWADRSRRGDRRRPADPADARGAPAACWVSTTARPSTSSRRTTRRARSQRAHWPPTGRAFVSAGHLVPRRHRARGCPTSPRKRALANFSNELGALGGFRFLKNVTGFWLLEQCAAHGGRPPSTCSALAAGAP